MTAFGASDGLVDLYTWATGYGDLTHIIFAREPLPFEFRLIADPGYAAAPRARR